LPYVVVYLRPGLPLPYVVVYLRPGLPLPYVVVYFVFNCLRYGKFKQ
jgi:hypothetical protein